MPNLIGAVEDTVFVTNFATRYKIAGWSSSFAKTKGINGIFVPP
jgi:hypothetical protein